MSMVHWAELKKNEEAEDQFHCLPDDVVVNIFEKVSDIRLLGRCFVVSKRFSSLIPQVQTVSITTNAWDFLSIPGPKSERIPQGGDGLLGKFSGFLINNLVVKPLRYLLNLAAPLPSSSQLNFPHLVFQLKQVRSLNLVLVSDFNADDDSVFKWGGKFTSNLDSVTFLYAASLSKMMESEKEEQKDGETENEITREEMLRRVLLAVKCLKEAVSWLGILSGAFTHILMLQSITITDSNNKGVKLCLGGEKFVKCRSAVNLDKVTSFSGSWARENIRVGFVPVLQLPMSGYVMKGVTIVHFKLDADDDSDIHKAMLDAFVEEQGAFSEAAVQILENHKDCIKAMFHD